MPPTPPATTAQPAALDPATLDPAALDAAATPLDLASAALIGRLRTAPHDRRPQVASPEDADRLVRPLLTGLDREHCLLVSLDARNRLIAIDTVSIGSVDHTFMAPREIYRDALLRGAAAIMLAHNHPSGDPAPSPADRAVSRRLAAAGATLGVALVDHLIVGDSGFVSLAREGCL